MNTQSIRIPYCLVGLVGALFLVILLNILPFPVSMEGILKCTVDRTLTPKPEVNWLSWQLGMWLAFGWGIGELLARQNISSHDGEELTRRLLPEDSPGSSGASILRVSDMPSIHQQVQFFGLGGPLSNMITIVAKQFQSTQDVDICNNVLTSVSEMHADRIHNAYNMVRYITHLIPSLGFCGTVYGILQALKTASGGRLSDPAVLQRVIADLSVAFYTTLLALLLCCLLLLLQHIIQGREQEQLTSFTEYCTRNLINRLVS